MQAEHRLTPQDARQQMTELAREREEQEREKLAEHQHVGVDWAAYCWRRMAS